MNTLSIRNQIMHEQVVDAVMHTINGGMTTAGMTTGGLWKDRGQEVLAAMGLGISAKRKAEIECILANTRRREKQRLEFLVEQKRQEEEEHKLEEKLEKERNERLKKEGFIRRPSWDDDGQSYLPPWQRTTQSNRID